MTLNANIAILGAGNMGEALLRGLLRSEHKVRISVTTKTAESADALGYELVGAAGPLSIASIQNHKNANSESVRDADIVVIAVKPLGVLDLLDEIAKDLKPEALIISVAAGLSTSRIESRLKPKTKVLRAMPNIPAQIGKAATGIAAGQWVSEADIEIAQELFSSFGKSIVIAESRLDLLSAVSGSGPAYFYFLVEQFEKAAIDKGLTPEEASLLVRQTFIGAATLLERSGEEPQALRAKVTSPKGTTEQGIAALSSADLESVFRAAITAAEARAKELNQG